MPKVYLGITKLLGGIIMSDMAEARRHMHEREAREKAKSKSKTRKIKNFFFGCCKNK